MVLVCRSGRLSNAYSPNLAMRYLPRNPVQPKTVTTCPLTALYPGGPYDTIDFRGETVVRSCKPRCTWCEIVSARLTRKGGRHTVEGFVMVRNSLDDKAGVPRNIAGKVGSAFKFKLPSWQTPCTLQPTVCVFFLQAHNYYS